MIKVGRTALEQLSMALGQLVPLHGISKPGRCWCT